MFASDFQHKLRKLNKKLRIYCGDDDSKPAGIYYVESGEYEPVCGIDKHWLPEWPMRDEKGHILKGGWRRPLKILIGMKLVDRRQAERVFGTQIIGTREPSTDKPYVNRIQKEILDATTRGMVREGKPVMKKDEIMDLARELNNVSKPTDN